MHKGRSSYCAVQIVTLAHWKAYKSPGSRSSLVWCLSLVLSSLSAHSHTAISIDHLPPPFPPQLCLPTTHHPDAERLCTATTSTCTLTNLPTNVPVRCRRLQPRAESRPHCPASSRSSTLLSSACSVPCEGRHLMITLTHLLRYLTMHPYAPVSLADDISALLHRSTPP